MGEIERIQKILTDLEVQKRVKEGELKDAEKKLNDLQERVLQYFGTTDKEALLKKKDELDASILEHTQKLRDLGISI